MQGEKAGAPAMHAGDEPTPAPGGRLRVGDELGVRRAIAELTDVRVLPAREVDLQFARDEGEGFESVQDWHEAHERFFERTIEPDTLIDAMRFRVVERL